MKLPFKFKNKKKPVFASRLQQTPRKVSRERWRVLLKISSIILLAALLVWGWVKITNPKTFPITAVRIIGNNSFVNAQTVKNTISPYLPSGLVDIDLTDLKTQLEKVPWVSNVKFWRVWPHELVIDIQQQTPIAHWNNDELLNANGETFAAKNIVLTQPLPIFIGPEDEQTTVLTAFDTFNQLLEPLQLRVAAISLSPQGDWQIRLDNNMLLILGDEEVLARLQRFISVYNDVFRMKSNDVEYVDLRYSNGFSVKWRESSNVQKS